MGREEMMEERAAMERRFLAEMGAALTRCKSRFERDQCRKAYYDLIYGHADIIEQKHGFPGRLYRAQAKE